MIRVKMRKIYETAVILIGTLGWWGFVYPELCITEDVCEQEAEAEDEGFKAGKLCIKSRVLEYVYQVSDKELKEKELEYD